ncbi:hypothetical protein WSM22_17640 [Cytophagales bacterium WSM2-2]|nr:hypothetical protein WSM22_17640 [Cytophagales bacterium WSM2-2]
METNNQELIEQLQKSNFRWKVTTGLLVLVTLVALVYGQIQNGIVREKTAITVAQSLEVAKQKELAQKAAGEAMKQKMLAEAAALEADRQHKLAEERLKRK